MAERRITFDDIFAEDIFQRAATSAKALKETLEELTKTLKELSAQDKKVLASLAQAQGKAKDVEQLAKAVNKAEASLLALSAAQKALQKVQQQYKVLTSDTAKEIFKYRDATKELTNELRAQAASARAAAQAQELLNKVAQDSFESYFELADTLDNLRIVYKDLAASGKANTEEAQRILAAITQLDKRIKNIDYSVGQYQRNVGNYAGSIREFFINLGKEAENAGGAIGQLIGFTKGLGVAFRAAGGGLRGLAAAITLTSRALATSGILLLLQVAASALGKIADFALNILSNIGERLGLIAQEGVQAAQEALNFTRQRIQAERELAAAERERKEQGETEESIQKVYAAKRRLFELELNRLRQQKAQAEQQLQAEQGLTGSAEKRQELLEKLAQLEEQIAQKEEELKDLLIEERQELEKIKKEREELARQAEEERKKRLQALLEQMALDKERSKVRVEAIRQERDERLAQLEELRKQALAEAATAEERLQVEQAYQKRRAQIIRIAEAEIAEVRAEAANRATEIYLEAQKESLQLELTQIANKYSRLLKEIKDLEKELGEELTAEREALAEAEVRERIEILRKYALADVQAREEAAKRRLDLEAKNFDDEKAFEEYKQRKLLELQLQYTRERIAALQKLDEQLSDEQTKALIETLRAQEAILELRLRTIQNAAQNTKEELRKLADAIEKALQLYEALLDRATQRAERRLQRQQEVLSNRINLLIAQAEAGSISASDSIAELEKRQAELDKAQEALRQRAQRREAALGAFRAYAAQLAQGVNPAQALLNTLRDLTVITQFVRSLPVFFRGTEEIRPGLAPTIAGAVQDAYLVRVHQGERIVPADINAKLRGIANEDLPKLVRGGGEVRFDYDSLADTLVMIAKNANKTQIIRRPL